MMSKRFIGLFIPMLFCTVFVAKSQEAKMLPMFAIGNKWNTHEECDVFDGETSPPKKLGTDKTTYHYTIEREVEKDGKKYFEILKDKKPYSFMREDLTTGKVYTKGLDLKDEEEIFDYNRQVGEIYGNDLLRIKIVAITNRVINGVNRRIYQLAIGSKNVPWTKQDEQPVADPLSNERFFSRFTGFWIEGIGPNQGISGFLSPAIVGGNCTCEELLCFTDVQGKSFTLYPEKGCEINYKVPRSVETPLLSKAKIVYSEGQLQISLEDAKTHTLSVYDMAGQLLAHREAFVNSAVIRLPASIEKATVLIRIDDQSTLYTF